MQRQQITHDGHTTIYWTLGSEHNPPLVMVHGFRGTHHGLRFIAKQLADQFYIIMPDVPGFGESDALDHHDLAGYIAWLGHFIQSISDKPVYLLGHSFGSIVVSHSASHQPQLIKKLILVNPIVSAAKDSSSFGAKLTLGFYKTSEFMPTILQRWYLSNRAVVDVMSLAMSTSKARHLRQRTFSEHRRYFSRFDSPESVRQAFTVSVTETVASDLPVKSLLIAGQKDQVALLKDTQDYARHQAQASLVVIPDVGHLTHYETAPAVARAVRHFLATE